MEDPEPLVGRVIGTEDATPLEFWVGVGPDAFLQLDDVVALERTDLPGREPVKIYGVVGQVRARHEGARFDSDVWLIEDGVLPAEVSEAAQVQATRFEPEVFVPPLPGQAVRRATGAERDQALFFDGMTKRLPAGLTRDDEPLFVNLEFLDGTRGAHVNISGISGVKANRPMPMASAKAMAPSTRISQSGKSEAGRELWGMEAPEAGSQRSCQRSWPG